MMRRVVGSALFALVLLCGATASAQDDAARAKEHYDRGAGMYFQGDYGAAVLEFMRAYDALPEPVFLYNIAMSHWRLNNYDKAIEAGERALKGKLDAGLHAQIAARTLVFHQLRHIDSSNWTPAIAVDESPEPDLVRADPTPAPQSHTLRWVGLGTAVVGAGLLTGFTVAELGLQKKVSAYEDAAARGDAARYAELKSQIDRGQPLSLALLGGGAALVAVGAGLIVWDALRGGEREATVAIAPGSVTVKLTW